MSNIEEFDNYVEKLLQSQFDISEDIISHPLEKGQTREGFIKDEIKRRFENIRVTRGFISGSSRRQSSGQLDLIILKNNAQARNLGGNDVVNAQDALIVVEVKSCACGNDLRDLNDDIALIKSQNSGIEMPLFGIFCYRMDLTKKNIFKRFGFEYDELQDLVGYQDDEHINSGHEYPEIDFVVLIDNRTPEKYMYFQKTIDENGRHYYAWRPEQPITQHFWNLIQAKI